MITPLMVVDAARTWIGTPFHHQARVKGVGVDCVGLLIGVGRELGFWPPDFDYVAYGRDPHGGTMLREANRRLLHIPMTDAGPGCALLMRWHTEPQHIAILAGDTIIHSAASFKKVVEHRYDAHWQRRTQFAFRLPRVTYV